MPNKERERFYLDRLRTCSIGLPDGESCDSESPDFLIGTSPILGVEFTEFHLRAELGERPYKEVQSLQEQVIAIAEDVHASAGGPALYVHAIFGRHGRLAKDTVRTIGNALAEALLSYPMAGSRTRAFQFQRESYKKVAADPEYWPKFWGKVMSIQWGGFSNEDLASIKAPILIALGDHDFVRLEHVLEIFRLIPKTELAVIPDAGHFALFSEQKRVIPVVENFLEKPEKKIPIATAETGFHPGETR